MLVLSRLPGESVCVGIDITFTVLAVQGRRVRIGIDAPTQLRVLRQELSCSVSDEPGSPQHESAESALCT
jgi:carbon storage regulator